jgi:very-short-patch-repair endonuclease
MRRQTHLHFSRDLRRNPTAAEERLWGALRKRSLNGHRFNRQFRIGPYTVDFLCREKALVVEVDGDTHSSREERAYDHARTNYLRSLGYTVFRVENIDIYGNLDGVLDSLLLALERRPVVFSRKAPIRPSGTFPSKAGEG